MCSSAFFVVVACLSVISIAPASADVASTVVGLKDCCPNMPILVTEASVNACMPAVPVETKKGYYQFGGSSTKNRSCVLQCAFNAQNLLTTVGGNLTLDLAAIDLHLSAVSNANWTDVITQAKINCTSKHPNITKPSVTQKCTSGASEMSNCLYKFLISSCPASQIGPKPDCAAKLEKVGMTFFQKIMRIFVKKNATTTTTVASG